MIDTSGFAFPKPEKRKKEKKPLKRSRVKYRPTRGEKPDWEELRPQVLAKTENRCYLCGKELSLAEMTSDHVTIQPRGCKKNHDLANLMPADQSCNTRKGSRRIMDGVSCPNCGWNVVVGGPNRACAHGECFCCGYFLSKEECQ